MLLLSVIALGLIFADMRFNNLDATRTAISTVTTPLYRLADIPVRILQWGQQQLQTRSDLLAENQHLQAEALLLKAKVQQMATLRAENTHLRELLNATALLQDDVLVGELIGVSPDPVQHQVIINRGSEDGVYIGQPLIDSSGLMGQVIELTDNTSRVLLITDSSHALPVQVNRNGIRVIAEGVGSLYQMELQHVPATTDIRKDDLLVTSGLGQRFPRGYPVAVVSEVVRDPGEAFARVVLKPSASLDRSRHVLLVFTQSAPERAP